MASRPSKQKSIVNYVKRKDSLEEVIARCAAKDGFTFNQIATSEDLRKGFVARGYENIPNSVTGIISHISRFAQSVNALDCVEINKHKHKAKMSLVFDEWTSCASKRYLNMVLLGNDKFWNLGLARINE